MYESNILSHGNFWNLRPREEAWESLNVRLVDVERSSGVMSVGVLIGEGGLRQVCFPGGAPSCSSTAQDFIPGSAPHLLT